MLGAQEIYFGPYRASGGNVVSLSFIFPHPPEDNEKKPPTNTYAARSLVFTIRRTHS